MGTKLTVTSEQVKENMNNVVVRVAEDIGTNAINNSISITLTLEVP